MNRILSSYWTHKSNFYLKIKTSCSSLDKGVAFLLKKNIYPSYNWRSSGHSYSFFVSQSFQVQRWVSVYPAFNFVIHAASTAVTLLHSVIWSPRNQRHISESSFPEISYVCYTVCHRMLLDASKQQLCFEWVCASVARNLKDLIPKKGTLDLSICMRLGSSSFCLYWRKMYCL